MPGPTEKPKHRRLDPHRFDGLPIPKPGVRVRDESALDAARRHGRCLACGKPGQTVCHHTRSVGAGGSDRGVIPVCVPCHDAIHRGLISREHVAVLLKQYTE